MKKMIISIGYALAFKKNTLKQVQATTTTLPNTLAKHQGYKAPLVAASMALLFLGLAPKIVHSQEEQASDSIRITKRGAAIITQTPNSLGIELDSTFADKAKSYIEKDTNNTGSHGQLLIQGNPSVQKKSDGSFSITGNNLVIDLVGGVGKGPSG